MCWTLGVHSGGGDTVLNLLWVQESPRLKPLMLCSSLLIVPHTFLKGPKAAVSYRWRCSTAQWSPSSWLSAQPSSNERSGTRSLWWIHFCSQLCTDTVRLHVSNGKNHVRPVSHRQSWSEVQTCQTKSVGGDRGWGSTRSLLLQPRLPWLRPELWSLTW